MKSLLASTESKHFFACEKSIQSGIRFGKQHTHKYMCVSSPTGKCASLFFKSIWFYMLQYKVLIIIMHCVMKMLTTYRSDWGNAYKTWITCDLNLNKVKCNCTASSKVCMHLKRNGEIESIIFWTEWHECSNNFIKLFHFMWIVCWKTTSLSLAVGYYAKQCHSKQPCDCDNQIFNKPISHWTCHGEN